MAGFLLNEAAVKVKSEELHIPFSNLLPAAITEYLLQCLSMSSYAKNLWLKNTSSLGLDCYARKPVFELSYYYIEEKDSAFSMECMQEMLDFLKASAADKELLFTYQNQETEERSCRADIRIKMGRLEVPAVIRIEAAQAVRMQPQIGELRLFLQNSHVIQFLQYPSEQRIAENFLVILEKMELINDFSYYQEIYSILKKETLDGRKVQQKISEGAEEKELELHANRLDTVLSYRTYTYMKKKWKSYLKREKKTAPKWEEVIGMMDRFFTPLFGAICTDTIYIGDWMPELSRYLE